MRTENRHLDPYVMAGVHPAASPIGKEIDPNGYCFRSIIALAERCTRSNLLICLPLARTRVLIMAPPAFGGWATRVSAGTALSQRHISPAAKLNTSLSQTGRTNAHIDNSSEPRALWCCGKFGTPDWF